MKYVRGSVQFFRARRRQMAYLRTFFAPLFVCVLAVWTQAGDQPGKHLTGWGELTNPDGDCEVAVVKGKLTIAVPGKAHDFAADLKQWNSPRILTPVTGDLIVHVKVSGELKPGENSTIPGRRPYHGAGLLLVKDRDNYAS